MEKLNTILENQFITICNEIKKEILEQDPNKKKKYIFKPTKARFKLVVYFKDGNKRIFYSYDSFQFNKKYHIDEFRSVKKLLELVHKYKGTYNNALIYADTNTNSLENSKYDIVVSKFDVNGINASNGAVQFKIVENNTILNLAHLINFSEMKFLQ